MSDQYPGLGSVWYDALGRELTVHHVAPGDRQGREVRGRLVAQDGSESDYSTDQRGWAHTWRDREPPAQFEE
jgi:hypothetical protein